MFSQEGAPRSFFEPKYTVSMGASAPSAHHPSYTTVHGCDMHKTDPAPGSPVAGYFHCINPPLIMYTSLISNSSSVSTLRGFTVLIPHSLRSSTELIQRFGSSSPTKSDFLFHPRARSQRGSLRMRMRTLKTIKRIQACSRLIAYHSLT